MRVLIPRWTGRGWADGFDARTMGRQGRGEAKGVGGRVDVCTVGGRGVL